MNVSTAWLAGGVAHVWTVIVSPQIRLPRQIQSSSRSGEIVLPLWRVPAKSSGGRHWFGWLSGSKPSQAALNTGVARTLMLYVPVCAVPVAAEARMTRAYQRPAWFAARVSVIGAPFVAPTVLWMSAMLVGPQS